MAIQTKPSGFPAGLPLKQDSTAQPIVARPQLPAMEKVGTVKTVVSIASAVLLMGAGAQVSTAGEGLMAPVPSGPAPPPSGTSAQRPKDDAIPSTEGYVRLEMHVDNGQLSITGVKEVPGPLALPTTVTRGYAYEALIDNQQIALGSIPDVGVRRAFANRDVPDPQGKHYLIQVPTFDFFARIPKAQVSAASLPKLTVVLHQVRDAPDRLTALLPMQKQTGVDTIEAGRLSGINLDRLPPTVKAQLLTIIK